MPCWLLQEGSPARPASKLAKPGTPPSCAPLAACPLRSLSQTCSLPSAPTTTACLLPLPGLTRASLLFLLHAAAKGAPAPAQPAAGAAAHVQGTVVVTGGLGALGTVMATWLTWLGVCDLWLLGRSGRTGQ